ncbi:copper resistance protein B [Spongiibacter sp. KMU-158]|uniref:Copper resistance protein B n=1 Tax=Spongiibacter pelagi TaxID=2760804 RepID=A0A927GXH0_9GAMM|nr:copper resistance protein B [Spongiibacter pelagi]MBD2859414.1 copper resistance protein B [Spongiibacter pelagi]
MKTLSKFLSALLAFTVLQVQAMGEDDPLLVMGKLDQFEIRDTEGDNPRVLAGELWAGYDLSKLWLKLDAERVGGETEELEVQALYSRAISAFWNIQLGARFDDKPEPRRKWAVIGVQGLAPYFFDIDAALFFGEGGQVGLRLETEYEWMLTQRLVLSPDIEINLYGKNDPATEIGSGLADVEVGLRLRYEIRREFAPYIGVNWQKKYGKTADYAAGGDIEDAQVVIGVSAWF